MMSSKVSASFAGDEHYRRLSRFPLSITSLLGVDAEGVGRRSEATAVLAEADLTPLSAYGSPDFIFGKLLNVAVGDVAHFKFAPDVRVRFRGSEYRFEELQRSGAFKLVRHPQ